MSDLFRPFVEPPRPVSFSARTWGRYTRCRRAVLLANRMLLSFHFLLSPMSPAGARRLAVESFSARARERVWRLAFAAAARHGSPLDGRAVSERGKLSPELYSVPASAVPLVASHVDLPACPPATRLVDILPPAVRRLVAEPSAMFLPGGELPPPLPVSVAGHVFGSRAEYVQLLARMRDLRLLAVPAAVRGRADIFCVPKKPPRLRLIENMRRTNRRLAPPVPIVLPTLADLASLESSGPVVFGKTDISSFYTSLRLPDWLLDFTVLPRLSPAEARALGLGSCDVALAMLPMGFSHSVDLAQTGHEAVIEPARAAHGVVVLPRRWPADTPLRTFDRPLLDTHVVSALYVDDGVSASSAIPSVLARHRAFQDHATRLVEAAHLVPNAEKRFVPTVGAEVPVLGALASGSVLRVDDDRFDRLVAVTEALLRRAAVAPVELARLLGTYVWVFLLNRPLLAVFHAAFAFGRLPAPRRRRPLWPAVRMELRAAMGLLPVAFVDLAAPWAASAVATDASTVGFGMCAARVRPQFLRWAAAVLPAVPSPDEVAALRACFPPATWPWRVLFGEPWRFASRAHINRRELMALITAVRRLLSSPTAWGVRQLVLLDNAVVAGLVAKGRSSAPSLQRPARALAGLLLLSGMRLVGRFCPSEHNPADAPSRLYHPSA